MSSSSSRQPDFKAEFQQNMTQLDSIKTDIERKITEKAALSNEILPKLQDINRKLAGVLQKFNLLKGQITDLERRIQDKDQGIADAGNQCIGLENEIARLKQELASSQQQQQDLEQTYNIRFQELTEEKDKMRTEQEQMQQMIAQLKAQEEYLKQQILDCEERYRRLEGIMTQLSNENQELKEQHMALTQKIKDIRTQIDNLIAADKVDPTQITDLLAQINKIIDEINDDSSSGNNSSSVLGGLVSGLTGSSSSSSSSSSSPTVGQQMGRTLDDIYGNYNPSTLNNVNSEGMTLRQIIGNLYNKPAFNKDGVNTSKYSTALNAILRLQGRINSTSITDIFRVNRITDLDEDQLEGGKRSKKSKKSKKTQKKKKLRKHKGGFEYSGKSKRRRFSVTRSPRSSSPRSSSPRSSSQRSTYESQSMVPPKYKARGTKKSKM